MGLLQIGLLLAGLLCFVVSFFLSEKLSSSDINEFEKMSKADINTIVERQLRQADDGIKEMIDEGMEDAMEEFELKADKLLNQKIMSISDYSDSVLTSIEKSHKEVVFMYNSLIEKQEVLTELTKDIQGLESNLRQIKVNLEESVQSGQFDGFVDNLERIENIESIGQIIEETPAESIEEMLVDNIQGGNVSVEEGSIKDQNDRIIKMHKEGFSEVEIAKRLGRGIGEIKLVLGLFNKD